MGQTTRRWCELAFCRYGSKQHIAHDDVGKVNVAVEGDEPVYVFGVGRDAPVEVNEMGGAQSSMPYRFDLLDAKSMFELAGVLYYGANVRGYPEQNWRAISVESNLNHVLSHIFAFLAGDIQDDHLAHALCRMMFAVGVQLQGGPDPKYGTTTTPTNPRN